MPFFPKPDAATTPTFDPVGECLSLCESMVRQLNATIASIRAASDREDGKNLPAYTKLGAAYTELVDLDF
jgi:hypothetical protein